MVQGKSVVVVLAASISFILSTGGATQPSASGREPEQDAVKEERSATIKDRVVRIKPTGATFEIPESWLKWHAGFKNNLHLTRAELEKIKTAEGDWDKEFSEIVNQLLPFSECAAHVGGEGWGSEGVSFADLQMRVYVTQTSAEKVQAKMVESGKTWASKFSKEVTVARAEGGKWRRATLSYAMWYGDYGATATIDVYAQEFGMQTAVLVFMHTNYRGASAPLHEILRSFAWKP